MRVDVMANEWLDTATSAHGNCLWRFFHTAGVLCQMPVLTSASDPGSATKSRTTPAPGPVAGLAQHRSPRNCAAAL